MAPCMSLPREAFLCDKMWRGDVGDPGPECAMVMRAFVPFPSFN